MDENSDARSLPHGRRGLEQSNAVDPNASKESAFACKTRVQMRVAIPLKSNGMVHYELKRQLKLHSDYDFGLLKYRTLQNSTTTFSLNCFVVIFNSTPSS